MPEAPCDIATCDARELVRSLAGGGRVALAVPCDREYRDLATIEVPFPDDYSLPASLGRTDASLTILCNPNSPSGTRVPLDRVRGLAECVRGRLLVDERDLDPDVEGAGALGLANVTVLRSPETATTRIAEARRATRDRTIRALRAFRFDVWPSEAPYILARVGPEARSLRDALAQRNVRVGYVDAPRLADCIRIDVSTDPDMERFFAALTEILTGRKPRA